ncbi:FkbM family methyltransferase [Cyanobium sp. Morenito 9A2]|uniref:FkbM family methyltransferase n=1 Tax=Cyanobium sp. Morenito 9A2 TaxID=2823718 RepID=UPI0021BCB2AA|nr:FkbM family methyltransferase [Cyanobium sp. Morenito 9A2]MCP9849795.1 FkbM family methyltransferase [Cyanobium sp. Morenito 9A2]
MQRGLPYIWRHPLSRRERLRATGRYLRWQLGARLLPWPVAVPWVNGTSLVMTRGMTGATGNYYCGLHEWPDMAFVLHLLRPSDTFADLGANVGSYTVLASGAVGCSSLSFEPAPVTFDGLQRNLAFNHLQDRVNAYQAALGSQQGSRRFSLDHGPMNQVVGDDDAGPTACVVVCSIDAIPKLRQAALWKLDVEGHEREVLHGARQTLAEAPPQALLIEDRSPTVQSVLEGHGYLACGYDPWNREISIDPRARTGNQIWIRNVGWARERVASAPSFQVLGLAI